MKKVKKAVIVVGSHFAGKSKTINLHLKKKLGIGEKTHKFTRKGQEGFILSQSFEEADRDVDDVISNYTDAYELLVLAARPNNEDLSCLKEAKVKLSEAGYRVKEVFVSRGDDNDDYYDGKADEILGHLDS